MISVITSSYQEAHFKSLEKNVSETIGTNYELIRIENPGMMGICSAYNKGAFQAKYDVVCFVHDDVQFHTKNWGKTLLKILEDDSIGILGVAGGTYKSKVISSAWHNGRRYFNIIQHDGDKCFHWQEPHKRDFGLADVLITDGVFLGMRKKVWEQCKFDEKTLRGFHFYDMDICLSVKSFGLRVCVCYDILLEHFSFGSNNKEWYKQAKAAHKKWRSRLPWSLNSLSKEEAANFEYDAALHKLQLVFKNKTYTFFNKIKAIADFIKLNPFKLRTYRKLKQSILD